MNNSQNNSRAFSQAFGRIRLCRSSLGFRFACALFLSAAAIHSLHAANVLQNPGAETGNLNGWNYVATASVASTNDLNYNGGVAATASNILSHSGAWVFKTYNIAGGPTTIYQDVATSAGSQWSASVYAHSHQQDYISSGSYAHLQVGFYDSTGTNALAIYGSDILDPSGLGFPFTVTPPQAVDASGWMFLEATNSYSSDPASIENWIGPVDGNLVAPAGTALVRYQLEFDGGTGGGSVFWDDCDLEKLTASDPDITTSPFSSTIVAGQNATFTVVGSGSTTLSYQWAKAGAPLSNSGRTSGANSATLTISNSVVADSGSYTVIITDSNGSITSVPVTLTVLNPAAANNALGANAGFENGTFAPWSTFNGTGLPSTNSVYYLTTTPVSVYDGKYCAQVYNGGTDNGFYMDIAGVTPGSVWKADAYAYISTLDDLTASNTVRLQVQFRNGGTVLQTYESFKLWGLAYAGTYPMAPRDTWLHLPVTNLVDGADTVVSTSENMVAPAGTTSIRYQVYEFGQGGSGSVFWDNMALYQIIPVTITPSVSGGNYNISFPTRGGLSYAVLYKTSLTDSSWSVLTSDIPGTGNTVTVQDPITENARFYRVQVQ